MSYSLLILQNKNELKAYQAAEEALFLEHFLWAWFETEWNTENAFHPFFHPNIPQTHRPATHFCIGSPEV